MTTATLALPTVHAQEGGLMLKAPAFMHRQLTARQIDLATDYDGIEQSAFLFVTSLARAAWMPRKANKHHVEDRDYAMSVINGKVDVFDGITFNDLLAVLGCRRSAFMGARDRYETRGEREAIVTTNRRAELLAMLSHGQDHASVKESEEEVEAVVY
jgi:hypothetical protein